MGPCCATTNQKAKPPPAFENRGAQPEQAVKQVLPPATQLTKANPSVATPQVANEITTKSQNLTLESSAKTKIVEEAAQGANSMDETGANFNNELAANNKLVIQERQQSAPQNAGKILESRVEQIQKSDTVDIKPEKQDIGNLSGRLSEGPPAPGQQIPEDEVPQIIQEEVKAASPTQLKQQATESSQQATKPPVQEPASQSQLEVMQEAEQRVPSVIVEQKEEIEQEGEMKMEEAMAAAEKDQMELACELDVVQEEPKNEEIVEQADHEEVKLQSPGEQKEAAAEQVMAGESSAQQQEERQLEVDELARESRQSKAASEAKPTHDSVAAQEQEVEEQPLQESAPAQLSEADAEPEQQELQDVLDIADAIGMDPTQSERQQSFVEEVAPRQEKVQKKQTKARFTKSEHAAPDEMEPSGDLSFNTEKSNFELLIDQFDTVTDLNWCWLRGKEDGPKECYDDIASMCLEMNYKCYTCIEDDKERYRFVQFQPNLIVDLEFLCETTEKFEENGYETERTEKPEDHKRQRPPSIFNQYKHPVKPPKRKKGRENNPLLHSEDKVAWLATEWYNKNQQAPTRSQILKGVINADRMQMLRLFPKYPVGHASMDKVLAARKLAWQLLSIVSGFSNGDANEQIEESVLQTQPDDPVVQTILYMISMESPIKYLLNSVSKTRNEDLITDLGPIAYALKHIVNSASQHRPDAEKKIKFWCFLGMPLLEAQIADIKELEPGKKEEAVPMALFGFNACYDRRKAQEKAWEHVEKSTTPCILQIEYSRETDYFKINRPDYTPYHQSEQLVLLQDGVKLEVQSVTKEQVVVEKKKKTQYKICLRAN